MVRAVHGTEVFIYPVELQKGEQYIDLRIKGGELVLLYQVRRMMQPSTRYHSGGRFR